MRSEGEARKRARGIERGMCGERAGDYAEAEYAAAAQAAGSDGSVGRVPRRCRATTATVMRQTRGCDDGRETNSSSSDGDDADTRGGNAQGGRRRCKRAGVGLLVLVQ